MLVSSTHFPPGIKPEQIGQKAVVVNLSDIAAMGAEPLGLVFSVALPRDLDIGFARRLMKGMNSTALKYKTYVVGGDLDEGKEITIAGTAFGLARRGEILKRSGAREGDVVMVTGEIGAASAGLKVLLKKLPVEENRKLVNAQLEPKARVKEGMALARSGWVKAAIDISDGLVSNLMQLARESKVKIMVDYDKIPVNALVKKFSERYRFDIDDFALFGGEDFELIFTVPPARLKNILRALKGVGTKATPIGEVAEGTGVFIRKGERVEPAIDRGYEHFR
jgi:thiamine-monophosphate kinase